MSAEELFALGTDELGCLEDKDKPGAKVSAVKYNSALPREVSCYKGYSHRCASSLWSSRDSLPVFCWWTNRAPPRPTSLTALAGTAMRCVVIDKIQSEGLKKAEVRLLSSLTQKSTTSMNQHYSNNINTYFSPNRQRYSGNIKKKM